MPLVELPALDLGQPQPPAFFQREMQSLYCPRLERGEGESRQHALFGEQSPGGARFLRALFGHVDIPPAGEAVLEVPLRLAVAEQDEGRHQPFAFALNSGRIA